jgi:glycine/D-amino acid oxidase-like deaminating enzyme
VSARYEVIVIGGGAYGCILALDLHKRGVRDILILEREPRLITRASFANQARVHNGYHYPRSFLTAHRSRVNYARFTAEYRDCLDAGFTKYYAVSRVQSNVSARQFELFCDRIGAPLEPASEAIRGWFDPDLVEAVFRVEECAFHADKLRDRLAADIADASIELCLDSEAQRTRLVGDSIDVEFESAGSTHKATARSVLNCTYSRVNKLALDSGLEAIPLQHELTELGLVDTPQELRRIGITVMCGPFFSLMPFPPTGGHSLSHVRYTPHCAWQDHPAGDYHDPYARLIQTQPISRFEHMRKDAQRYMPLIADCTQTGSLWEIKTVLPMSEVDDSRPILLSRSKQIPGLIHVMGSKIDNVYDVMDPLAQLLETHR